MPFPRIRALAALAALLAVASCGRDALLAPPQGGALTDRTTGVRLTLVSGGNQTGTAGQPLPRPIVVRVVDQKGQPVRGGVVNFLATQYGSVSPRQATTDSAGYASARWTLAPIPGPQQLRVSGTGGTLLVPANGRAGRGVLYLVKVAGDEQTARAGTLLPARLQVAVFRDDGKPVPANTVIRWRPLAGGGSVNPTSTRISGGRASTAWTLGPAAGTQTAEASASGAQPVVFTATATQPPPPVPPTVTLIQKRVASPYYGFIDVSQHDLVLNFWIQLAAPGNITGMKVRDPSGRSLPCGGMQAWEWSYREFWCQVYLPRGAQAGTWVADSVSMVVNGATVVASAADLTRMATAGRAFDVLSTGSDAAAPVLRVVWPHGRGSDPAIWWLKLGVVDHITGTRSVSAVVQGPGGATQRCDARPSSGALARVSDWLCPLRIPSGSGRWRLVSVTTVDGLGNTATYTPAQIDAAVRGVFELTFLEYEWDL